MKQPGMDKKVLLVAVTLSAIFFWLPLLILVLVWWKIV